MVRRTERLAGLTAVCTQAAQACCLLHLSEDNLLTPDPVFELDDMTRSHDNQ